METETSPLPELMNNQAKLTASRVLRVRKVLIYVMEKLESIQQGSSATDQVSTGTQPIPTSRRASSEKSQALSGSPNRHTTSELGRYAEEEFEILCNDMILPANMTLAAVRHYIWKQSADLVLHYRRKLPVS